VTLPVEPQPRRVALALPFHRPVVTWVLLGLVGAAFLAETALGGSTDTEVLVRLGAKVTALIAAGEYWRLFTAMFLHIGIMHLFFNGYALLAIGTELERLFGPGRFTAIYLLAGLLGNLASYAFSPHLAAGASGAIFGLIGALAAFFLLHRERLGSWGRSRLANIAFLIAINLFFGFTQPGIDNLAHLGGLLGGLGLGWALSPRYHIDPTRLELVDGNRLARYWPALAVTVLVFTGGTILGTLMQRDSPRTHLFRGQQAIEQGAWEEAIVELEQALVDPSLADPSVYFYLGLAHSHLEEPEAAAAAYESALDLAPDDSYSHWNLALTYLQLRRYAEARAQFEAYLSLNPNEAAEVQPYLDELVRLGY
jgi:rhomboid protease GluP